MRNRKNVSFAALLCAMLIWFPKYGFSQIQAKTNDSIIYHIIYRDTIVYRYDTIWIKRYISNDTLLAGGPRIQTNTTPTRKWGWYNPNSWGIGPSVGAYYSPIHGFDLNFGLGIQYYMFAVPSFRNPHMGGKRKKK